MSLPAKTRKWERRVVETATFRAIRPTRMILALLGALVISHTYPGEAAEPETSNAHQNADTCLHPEFALSDRSCSWTPHTDNILGLQFDYPTALFEPLETRSHGLSKTILVSNGELVVAVWTEVTSHTLRPSEAMATDLYNIGLTQTLRREASDFEYTISGAYDLRSLVKRRIYLTSDPRVSATICITWPKTADENWTALASRIASSLQLAQDGFPDTSRRRLKGANTGHRCMGL